MAANLVGARSSDATVRRVDVPPAEVTERITVALLPKVAADLQQLQERTGLSKTDIINRAITLYEFISAQQDAGREVLIRDKKTGETRAILFL